MQLDYLEKIRSDGSFNGRILSMALASLCEITIGTSAGI